jgi:alcohol dehydrogenase class IV
LDARSFPSPVDVRFGRGSSVGLLDDLPRPVVLATGGSTLERAGLDGLEDPGGGVHVHAGVLPLARGADVDALAEALLSLGARSLVAVGGGSVIDTAKTAAVVAAGEGDLASQVEALAQGGEVARFVRLVAVPTTAGTGSEVTRWASLWTDAGAKWSFDHEAALPDRAVVDPALTDSMDARLTAATGLDAVAHAMESLWCERTEAVSAREAQEALRLLAGHLPRAVRAGAAGERDDEARDAVALGALRAGLALSHTASGAAHALSYALTGRFGLEHGLAVGLLSRALLPRCALVVPQRVERVLAGLDVDSVGAAQAFVDEVLSAAGLSPSLEQFGVGADAFEEVVAAALASPRLDNHPGPPGRDELRAALESIA